MSYDDWHDQELEPIERFGGEPTDSSPNDSGHEFHGTSSKHCESWPNTGGDVPVRPQVDDNSSLSGSWRRCKSQDSAAASRLEAAASSTDPSDDGAASAPSYNNNADPLGS